MANNKARVLFWLSPVLGLVEAFRNLESKQSRTVLFAFCLCFGLCFTIGTERYEGSTDGVTMRAEFEESKSLSTTQFVSYLSDYFKSDMGAQDIYIVTVSYLVGRFTDNYHYFFLALAFVFAFFQLKCLKFFVKEENFTNSIICIILACLFLWNNIYNINGARFWTASWIGLYCVFRMFYDKKPLYILLSFITPMVHAAFVVFPFVLILGYLIREMEIPLLIVFIVSWVFSFFADDFHIQFFNNIELPFLVGRKVEAYTNREVLQGSGFHWVGVIFDTLSKHCIELVILLIAINRKSIKDKRSNSIIGVMIVLAIIANFGMVVPTFGKRFFAVNYALVAYSFLVTFGDKKYRTLVYLLPFMWFMNLFYLARHVMGVLDLGFLLSPIISFFRFTFV